MWGYYKECQGFEVYQSELHTSNIIKKQTKVILTFEKPIDIEDIPGPLVSPETEKSPLATGDQQILSNKKVQTIIIHELMNTDF